MISNKGLADVLAECITACEYCSDACLNEENIKMLADCIRNDRDCADICRTALNYISRDSQHAGTVIEICARICSDCADECEKHADHHDHCRYCAEVCRRCEEECKAFVHA
jgi:hypothetical protein